MAWKKKEGELKEYSERGKFVGGGGMENDKEVKVEE